jgi:hypothetical protein
MVALTLLLERGETHGQTTPQAGLASNLKRTVMPWRRPNAELRRREHLTEAEVERLMEAAKGNRWGIADAIQGFLALVSVARVHAQMTTDTGTATGQSQNGSRPASSPAHRREKGNCASPG